MPVALRGEHTIHGKLDGREGDLAEHCRGEPSVEAADPISLADGDQRVAERVVPVRSVARALHLHARLDHLCTIAGEGVWGVRFVVGVMQAGLHLLCTTLRRDVCWA